MLASIAIAACGGGSTSTPPATYTISGTVTGATSVTITLSGASTATATTAANGSYSFAGLANGSYTVTPSKTGFAFNPTSTSVSVSGANVTGTDFTATSAATTYSISGSTGIAGATITLSGANTGSVTTGAGGAYTISGLVPGSYTVTPSLSGFTFSPTSAAVTITTANSTANDFVATAIPVPHSISGTISGPAASGATISVTGTATATTTTAANGSYTVTGLYDGNYTLTPSKSGYTFTPTSASVTMSGANITGQNFASAVYTAPTYTLSGQVTGPYVDGVTITLGGAGSATTTTNASGNYSFANLPAGTYTVTPSLAGYTYSPSAPSVGVNANTTQNFTASSAIASYSISGTVSYAGAKTGSVYLRVWDANCSSCETPRAGTRITLTAGSGTYTVRGLQDGGNYVVGARMDTLDTGAKNASNPTGNSTTVTVSSANLTGVNVTLADPATPVPVTPTGLAVFPSSGAALIFWDASYDANGAEIATSYKIYWGTDAAATNGTPITVAARDDAHRIQSGLTNGTAYYYKITALVGATESAPSAVVGPVTINATTGLSTVSGAVTFSGTATGPMLVGLFSETTGVYFTRSANPASPQSYSIAGVPNGSYYPFAIIDMNNNGVIDTGDISNTDGSGGGQITVSGNTTSNITLPSASATTSITTDHMFDGVNHTYQLGLSVNDGTKRVAAVTLVSGLNVAVPFDMGKGWEFQMWQWLNTTSPTVGNSYMFKVTFSDGSTQNISGSVTAVLGTTSLAQNLTVQATTPGSPTVPLFKWTAPASPPASYVYYLSLWGANANWYYPQDNGMPSTTLSALYNADGRASIPALTTGTTYTWGVQVRDANGNKATRQTTYTP